jgi:hypothetical protein
VFIQDPVSLCGVTRCSDRLSGARGGIGRFSGPKAQFHAGSCKWISENATSLGSWVNSVRCPQRASLGKGAAMEVIPR